MRTNTRMGTLGAAKRLKAASTLAVVILGALLVSGYAAAEPVLSDISVSQRTDGSGKVDVYYTLASTGGYIVVEMTVSTDNGATWSVTPNPQHLSGDVGGGVSNGNNHIVWDVVADMPNMCWPEARVKLNATDETEITILLPDDVPLVLVYIPAGTYMRGRYAGEQDSFDDEDPQHEVTLTQDFYLGKYPLTQQQWLALMGSWPGTAPSSSYGVGDSYPAYYVSWDDAQNFITALNAHITSTGQGSATFRLPTEAEWEYACRAGTTTRFYWGDDPDYTQIGDYAWYTGNNSPYGSKPVGGKLPNAFGLYDMSGNVYEWCQDWYGTYPSGSVTDPTGPTSGSGRVRRGGGWGNYPRRCRSAFRNGNSPGFRYYYFGFRLAALPAVR